MVLKLVFSVSKRKFHKCMIKVHLKCAWLNALIIDWKFSYGISQQLLPIYWMPEHRQVQFQLLMRNVTRKQHWMADIHSRDGEGACIDRVCSQIHRKVGIISVSCFRCDYIAAILNLISMILLGFNSRLLFSCIQKNFFSSKN